MAKEETLEDKYEAYLRQLGKELTGINKVVLAEEFWEQYTNGLFSGLLLLIHRPQWRGNNLREPYSEKAYSSSITVLKCLSNLNDFKEKSDVISECGTYAEQIMAKMIVDSMARTKMVNNRIVANDHFMKHIGEDVSANPVHPKDINSIAGVQVDFSFRTLSGIKVNEDLWQ